MMKFVSSAITRKFARSALLAQKNSPGVLFGAGVVGMTASTVLACRATLKMDKVVEEAKDKMKVARTLDHPEYSDLDRQRDLTLIRYQTTVKIVRLYAPAIIVGGVSIAALSKSHSILNKRNAALTAAYAALDKGFNEYRSRVIAKYGEEEDRDLRYGTRQVATTDSETGERKLITRVAPGDPSIYARFFDENSPSWNREPEYNLFFIKCQQNYANDLLHSRGHLFLNEVYGMLGIPHSKAGAVVGWILTPEGHTDNYVNFGVFEGKTEQARDFVNGFEGSILLDFNVDGVIFDKIELS
jgi:hypothetical protein